jgi:hypothetical protein
MQYPVKKTLLIVCLAIASAAFAAKKIAPEKKFNPAAVATTTMTLPAPAPAPAGSELNSTTELYTSLHLEAAGMNPEALDLAIKGFNKLVDGGKLNNIQKITIIDFSQPSTNKRLYVIDLDKKQVLFQSLVAHGRGTGTLWAQSFSNQAESFKSSPGFYITAETYLGENGYSLRLDGVEDGINDNARNRSIVMHGAPYASASTINALGFLGRSQGCPALPQSLYKPIINTIKSGTCLFIYTPDQSYIQHSELLS